MAPELLEVETDFYDSSDDSFDSFSDSDEEIETQYFPFDTRADIWSFGVLLFEMLTGSSPFRAATPESIKSKIKEVNFESFRIPNREHARDLIEKLLVKDPNQRLSINEIKAHPFYESINWQLVETKTFTPLIPSWATLFYQKKTNTFQ